MGIFAISIATAVLPPLSEQASKGLIGEVKETLSFALRLTFFVILPAMAGLIALRTPILNTLFQRGAFNAFSTEMTSQALLYYSLGLAAFAGVRIVAPVFYSLQDTRTPVKVAFLSLIANAGLGVLLMSPLRHGGLALATSLAAGLNFGLLAILLRRKIGPLGAGRILRSSGKHLGASLLMGVVAYEICSVGRWEMAGFTWEKLGLLSAGLLVGTLVYAASCYFMGSEEFRAAIGLLRRRLAKGTR
jgi:putative peptidoglycan lipid II flippase